MVMGTNMKSYGSIIAIIEGMCCGFMLIPLP